MNQLVIDWTQSERQGGLQLVNPVRVGEKTHSATDTNAILRAGSWKGFP